jgi:hypothetical protein
MIKLLPLLFLIIVATTGCKVTIDEVAERDVVEPKAIATLYTIPDSLQTLPPYPEDPEKIVTKEFTDGYEVKLTVPNAYAVARAAWITAFQERLWQIENEIVISENNFSWVVMKKDENILFIKIESINDETTALTTFLKK